MSKILIFLCAAALCPAAEFDHAAWDRALKKHVTAIGEVDYAAWKKDRAAELDPYVRSLAEASPDNRKELFPSREHELAYWLNAYNALVSKGVVDAYPTKSVRDLGAVYGFFRRKDFVLGGRKLSLQALENEIIRGRYKEPRIHFAIVCASLSCPRLQREALAGAALHEQLTRFTREFLAERRNLRIGPGNEITLSALFDWYKSDYGGVLSFVLKYSREADRKAIEALQNPKLKYFEYDWSINEPGSRARAKSPYERELARGGS